MDQPSQPFSLLRLPAELRTLIFEYVLSGETFSIHCWRRYTPFGFATRIVKKRKNFLALLSTNRQIYAETRLLPFQLNTFLFKHQSSFHAFLDHLTFDQQNAIRRVELVTWMVRHMVEGENWMLSGLEVCFPVERFGGLRIVRVQVRMNGRVGDCVRDDCLGCEKSSDGVVAEEDKFRTWIAGKKLDTAVEVTFERVPA